MSAVVQHPRAVELVERAKLRKQVARAVSRLIAILDELDADPEAEPWLGASEASVVTPQWPRGSSDDREEENEHGGDILDGGDDDRVDNEPSLGSLDTVDQRGWGRGARRDLEAQDHV